MIRRIGFVMSVLLWLLSPCLAAADASITVVASDVHVDFPNEVVFTLEAESSADIVDVRLCYQVNRMNYAQVVSEGCADFSSGDRVEARWVWDMKNAALPPGTEVTYWWTIEDADGDRVETSPEVMHFDDDRYTWQSLTAIIPETGELTLFWYEGSSSFAQALMAACQEGLARLTGDIGAYPERPIKIYVYASMKDLQGAMIYSQEWTGGAAFPDFGTIAISIPANAVEWGERAVVHELTHLVVHQATFSPYGQLPVWLEEGLAMYNEGDLEPVFRSCLEEAISADELISVRSLCSPFSAYSKKALLSYAQSYSLVEYLLENYGRDRMLDLLTVLKDSSTYDEALVEVYGFDIEGLDARWRATLGLHPVAEVSRSVGEGEMSAPHPRAVRLAVLAALATGFTLWGALALEGCTWRRPSRK
ncbi:MAG: peptidase MA family metallohydrolase [Dehalococcoidia bacterium]